MWRMVLVGAMTVSAVQGQAVPGGKPSLDKGVVCPENGPFPFSHGSTLVEFPDGRLFCAWYAGSREKGNDVAIVASESPAGGKAWSPPRVLVDTPDKSEGNPALFLDADGTLWLFYQTMYGSGEGRTQVGTGWTTCKVKTMTSTDGGTTWSDERILVDELGYLTRNKPIVSKSGRILLPIHDERNWSSRVLFSDDKGATWEMSGPIDCGLGFHDGNIEPALLEREDGSILCLMRTGSERYEKVTARFRTWASESVDEGLTWTEPVEVEVPNPDAALDLLRLDSGNVLMALNPVPNGGRRQLSVWLSTDEGKTWRVSRDVENGDKHASYPALVKGNDGRIHMTYSRPNGGVGYAVFNEAWVWEDALVKGEYKLANVVPPLFDTDDPQAMSRRKPGELPVEVAPFQVHVKGPTPDGTELATYKFVDGTGLESPISSRSYSSMARDGSRLWAGTGHGLYCNDERHEDYGIDGPLSTRITGLAVDSRGVLWVGTPLGLSVREPDGTWRHVRGRDGLPYEDITDLAVDCNDRLWICTTRGAIQYRPYEEGRQWFYRAGKRYLPGDHLRAVGITPDGKTAYFDTTEGPGRIDEITTTLLEKAQTIERRVNERHRRLGMVAACTLDDAENPTSHTIGDNDNDGLWTAYHVAAMSLCYAVTGDDEARRSAQESMDAMYMLQNASGTPGLVARSVVPAEIGKTKDAQWRPTPDGTMYWKSDTSSDEIDGHYLAFYTYWEHIARFIPEERERCIEQVRALTDYLVDNGYQLMDWDGKRTRWGFWNPEALNDDPNDYLENGLNSLQMLSFLKTAHHITGDAKYKEHYDKLIVEHGYLSNVLLAKKLFPDSNNHSDDQLGYVAWYPILQMEADPKVRDALHRAVRRHYKVIAPKKASFFILATASIDRDYVDVDAAVDNLREIPADRRNWRMENSHRADVVFDPRIDRFGKSQLIHILPADERDIAKWNRNPYVPDLGGDGRGEDDGAAYLLPYWMGRYHGLIAEQE
jgi:predicted neuraminidase